MRALSSEVARGVMVRVRARDREWILHCFFVFFPCLLALMAWGLLSRCSCACESVGVAQEARDHSYFHTPSVVNKVHPVLKILSLSNYIMLM